MAERLGELCRVIADATQNWPSDLERQVQQLGTWITARERSVSVTSLKLDQGLTRRAELNAKYEEVLREGTMLRDRKASLEATRVLLPSWSPEHDHECPTCGSDVSAHGGISAVVSELLKTVDELLELRREEVRALQELTSIAELIAKSGGEEPPVLYSDQPALVAHLALLLPDEGGFEQRLGDEAYRNDILRLMHRLRSAPKVGVWTDDSRLAAQEIADEMETVAAEFERVAALPAAWKAVRDAMQNRVGSGCQFAPSANHSSCLARNRPSNASCPVAVSRPGLLEDWKSTFDKSGDGGRAAKWSGRRIGGTCYEWR